MKIVIALFLIIASVYSQQKGVHVVNKGKDLINLLEGDLPGTYLVFFYDHNSDRSKTSALRKSAREQVLARHPDIHYYEIDVDDAEFQDIVELIQIDKVEVGHMPTFLVMTQGLGYTVHGEDAVSDIVKSLATKDWWLAHDPARTAKPEETVEGAPSK